MQGFWRTVSFVINRADILLEVLDARMPDQTRNRDVENSIQRRRKTLILVLNKADLITERMREDFLKVCQQKAVFVSSKRKTGMAELEKMIVDVASRRKWSRKVRVGVIGYPNTGKSSVINSLTGRHAAKTSPMPGMTRGVQWISGGDEIMFLDTPGVMPMDEKDETDKALMSAMDPDNLENPGLAATTIIRMFLETDKKKLEKLYEIEIGAEDAEGVLLKIGGKKNFLARGGKVDETRTARLVIRDWQRGKLLLNFAAQ